jgi:hypothetical protein
MKPVLLSLAAAIWLVPGGAALADVIDGNWCQADGRSMHIAGPTITTPAGHTIQGNYSRHSFSYTVPESEPSAGATIYMRLLNETTVDLWNGTASGDAATAEVWKRCMPISDAAREAVHFA